MKPRASPGFFLVLAALVVGGGTGLALQWRQSMTLRTELKRSTFKAEEMAHLRAENQRLREKQIPAVELERLRADHAALPRLRAEIEALNKPSPVKGP
jgi:hypothetical protein